MKGRAKSVIGIFVQEIPNYSWNVWNVWKFDRVSRPYIGEHVKQSVPVVVNIYDNRNWEITALKYTDNYFDLRI